MPLLLRVINGVLNMELKFDILLQIIQSTALIGAIIYCKPLKISIDNLAEKIATLNDRIERQQSSIEELKQDVLTLKINFNHYHGGDLK